MVSAEALKGLCLCLVKRKLNEITLLRTGVWVEFGLIQCIGELFNALFVAVQFPVATDEKLPASHDCKMLLSTENTWCMENTDNLRLKRQRGDAAVLLGLYKAGQ